MEDSLEKLLDHIVEFHEKRDWTKYHSPKNVAMDVASEAGELVDPFRWVTEEESYNLGDSENVKDEIGDVFRAIIYLAHRLGIDPIEAAYEKLEKLGKRYPAEKCYGLAKKYTEYITQD